MPIVDEVSAALKDAMRARDRERTSALRNIRAAFIAAMKEDGSETLSDDVAQGLLRTLAKQRVESAEAYAKGGRDDLEAAERAELAVIEAWLPSLADEAQTRAWVQAAVDSTGAASMSDIGKVMGAVMRDHRGEVDGKLAQKVLRELLA